MKKSGFTLLEMAVTVFIFGLIGVIAVQLLSQSVRTTDKVIHRTQVLGEWHRAMALLEQDFLQLSHRSIRDEYGVTQPSFLAIDETGVEFTRLGWQNALSQQRSELQRVYYFLDGTNLIRRFWSVLDRPYEAEFVDQLLLSGVESIEFRMIDSQGRDHPFWPATDVDGEEIQSANLIAVQLNMKLIALGEVSQLWLVPESPQMRSSPEIDKT